MSDRRAEFEIVIVGAGPAGLAAACAAAESGKSVAVVDNTQRLGGQIWRGGQSRPVTSQARHWFEKFRRSGVKLLDRTSVIASPAIGLLLAERQNEPLELSWEKLILATGARELFLPFPGWTLPGVFGVGGLQTLVKTGWPITDKRVIVCGTGPLLLAAADGLKKHGAKIICIAEQAPFFKIASLGVKLFAHPQKVIQGLGYKARLAGVPHRHGVWPVKAHGGQHVRAVELTNGQTTWVEECDALACGFHLVPNVELPSAMGCRLVGGFVAVDNLQTTSVPDVYCAGEPTGIGGVDAALIEGQIAGFAAAGQPAKAEGFFKQRRRWHAFREALAQAFVLRDELKSTAKEETVLCRCEDVTYGRLKRFTSWREAKLQTRCGMGACQGRTCGAATKFIFGWGTESLRPPVFPARINSLITTTNEPK